THLFQMTTPRFQRGVVIYAWRFLTGRRRLSVARRPPLDQREIGVRVRRGIVALRVPDDLAQAFHDGVLRLVGRAHARDQPLVRAPDADRLVDGQLLGDR